MQLPIAKLQLPSGNCKTLAIREVALPKRPRQVCVKVEDLNWDSKDVSGAVYAGVEVKAVGKKEVKFWKITSFSIPV